MGLEAKHTTITIDGQTHAGDALLESDEVFVRIEGESKRRRLKLAALAKVRGEGSTLSFEHEGVRYAIEVAGAARWATKILSPPSLLDKLGIRDTAHVAGLDDETAFQKALKAAKVKLVPLAESTSVVVGVTTRAQLSILARARRAVGDSLALWIVYPRGQKTLTEEHVRAAAIAEGLVDVKVARFSDTRSALKLVVRKSERGR
jgi:hypothetical protein